VGLPLLLFNSRSASAATFPTRTPFEGYALVAAFKLSAEPGRRLGWGGGRARGALAASCPAATAQKPRQMFRASPGFAVTLQLRQIVAFIQC